MSMVKTMDKSDQEASAEPTVDTAVVLVERPNLCARALDQAISGRPLTAEQRDALRGLARALAA